MPRLQLGRLEQIYGVAPAYLQRAAIVCLLSFVFFLAMMIAFSIRQNIGYFILATAFLIVNILTMLGWMTLRKNVLYLYENGFIFKKFETLWTEIDALEVKMVSRLTGGEKYTVKLTKTGGEQTTLTDALNQIEQIVERISDGMDKADGVTDEDEVA